MTKLAALSRNDFRTTFREPLFRVLLAFPLMAFALVRWVLPMIIAEFPVVAEYAHVIIMWACMQSATMFGFIYGFLFLEEKEEDIFTALRITPISPATLVGSRLGIGIAVTTFVNFFILHFGGFVDISIFKELLIAFNYSLMAPFMTLLLILFAQNRVQGLAQMKIFNLLLIIPALIYFFEAEWLHILALVPTYWSFRSIEGALAGDSFWFFWLIGTAYYLLLLLLLLWRMKKKVY